MDARHCKNKNECKKPDFRKRECKKSEKKCKSSSSSDDCKKRKKCKSSSSSDCKVCVPKVVYQICTKNGQQSLDVTFVVTTPNNDQPPTYTCPAQIGQKIYITYTITNTGTATIRAPVMLYSSITGVSKVTCKKLRAGQVVTVVVKKKITACDCRSLTGISGVANAYANMDKHCLVLVSQPIAIQIDQTVVV